MTATDFRKLSLDLPGAVESQHMNHPDFRVNGKIFATLGYPNENTAMVKLTPPQQRSFIRKAPDVFRPCSGVWGERGATNVHLPAATKGVIRAALDAAWKNVIGKAKKKRA
jgi:hypothetical protein